MVVEVVPVVLVATTTDAGRHWELSHLPPPAERLLSADDTCLPGCVDVVSARTWLVGSGHELYTTTDAGRSWRASPSSMAVTNRQPGGFQQPDPSTARARFPGPEGGLGRLGRMVGRYGPPMAYDRRWAALVGIFPGPASLSHFGPTSSWRRTRRWWWRVCGVLLGSTSLMPLTLDGLAAHGDDRRLGWRAGLGPSDVPERTAHGSWDPAQSRWAGTGTLGCTYTLPEVRQVRMLRGYPRCSSEFCDFSS